MNFDELRPETLTEEQATAAWEWLRSAAKERHARIARERRGVTLRGFCVCGHSSMGVGGELCGQLRDLAEGGDEAEWIAKARALRAELTKGAAT
jgi:hypothetical protein